MMSLSNSDRKYWLFCFCFLLFLRCLLCFCFSFVFAAQSNRYSRVMLEEAIRYMEAAPHDFGGHKAAAIRDSRAAVTQLGLALAYRARQDR